jgi:2-desacetyl-2-hydroxyethyl bacteriochlorophyllide A dehydrogenase
MKSLDGVQIPKKMRAAVLYGFNDVRLVDRDVPQPGPDEVLIKIAACSVCAGDIKIISRGMLNQPAFGSFVIGHEYAGTVVALGDNVTSFGLGDRVTVEVHKGCGQCRNCLEGKYTACLNYGDRSKGHRANGFTTDGGFAEFAVNHVNTVVKVPDNISFDEATIITTAGTPLFGIDKAGGYIVGDSVAVLGPGSIGLMAVQCAKALGAEPVILTGTRKERLELGTRFGADHVINVREEDAVRRMREITGGIGVDLTLVASGSQDSLQQALEATRRGGSIVLLAHFDDPVTVEIGLAVQKDIVLYTVRGEGRRSVHRALDLMSKGKIDGRPLITHQFRLAEINKAIDTFVSRSEGALKVVIHP